MVVLRGHNYMGMGRRMKISRCGFLCTYPPALLSSAWGRGRVFALERRKKVSRTFY